MFLKLPHETTTEAITNSLTFSTLHPFRDAKLLQNSTTTQRKYPVADLAAAETSCEGSVTGETHEDQARVW